MMWQIINDINNNKYVKWNNSVGSKVDKSFKKFYAVIYDLSV